MTSQRSPVRIQYRPPLLIRLCALADYVWIVWPTFGCGTVIGPCRSQAADAADPRFGSISAPSYAAFSPEGDCFAFVRRLERTLHPWTTFVIIPLFALANGGLDLSWGFLSGLGSSAIGLGVFFGILLFSWLAVRLEVAQVPPGVSGCRLAGLDCSEGSDLRLRSSSQP